MDSNKNILNKKDQPSNKLSTILLVLAAVALIGVPIYFIMNGLGVKEPTLEEFIIDKELYNGCMSGEKGTILANGVVVTTFGKDYMKDDDRPNTTIGNWKISENKLTLSGTSISNQTYTLEIRTIGKEKYAIDENILQDKGCGIIIGEEVDYNALLSIINQ